MLDRVDFRAARSRFNKLHRRIQVRVFMTFKGATAQQHSPKRQASLSVMVGRLLVAMMALCLTAQLSPARADYGECERSYQLGRKDEAIRLCRRAAWQDNDFFAQVKLGDIYSAKREDDKGYYDPVEAYVWYFLATKNSSIFDHFHLDPAADFVVTRLANAATDADAIYRNLQRYVTAIERSHQRCLKNLQYAQEKRRTLPPVPPKPEQVQVATASAPLPEVGFEPQFVPSVPVSTPAYTDRC
jgi:hypothetical protein